MMAGFELYGKERGQRSDLYGRQKSVKKANTRYLVGIMGGENPTRIKKHMIPRRIPITLENKTELIARNAPVNGITKQQAIEFAKSYSEIMGLNARLIRDEEYEYALRVGTKTRFFWGDSEKDIQKYAYVFEERKHEFDKVGEKQPNPFGLFDMPNMATWLEGGRDTHSYVRGRVDLTFDAFDQFESSYRQLIIENPGCFCGFESFGLNGEPLRAELRFQHRDVWGLNN